MKVTINPSKLSGKIQAPASKSSMQRACAAALLTKGDSIILSPGHSNDDKAALDIIQRLGATIKPLNDDPLAGWVVTSGGVRPVSNEINCGESGLSIRMFTPLVALYDKPVQIIGSGSLSARPMDFFDEVLPKIGVKVKSNHGKLPLQIEGPLMPVDIEIDGSLSSQFLTGLLMAYAAAGADDVTIKVNDLKSRPYIDLTLDVMRQFGLPVPENNHYQQFRFKKSTENRVVYPVQYTVEGDWSGGAFLLVAGAIAGPVSIQGLDTMSTQADKAIMDALIRANAGMAIDQKGIHMSVSAMRGFDFDATDCPDLFPPLVALAVNCTGTTRVKGVSRLTHKESNRALTLQEEFGKMGNIIELNDDWMIIHGGRQLKGATVHSRHDHRIAMACAVAGLTAEGQTTIEEAQAINKSYPDFYQHLLQLKADISLNQQFKLHE